jgi:hypothetical protein
VGDLLEFEAACQGATVYVHYNSRWCSARVLEFCGECAKLRVVNERIGVACEEWFDLSEIRVKSPFVYGARGALVGWVSVYSVAEWLQSANATHVSQVRMRSSTLVCSLPLLVPGDPDEIEELKQVLTPRFAASGYHVQVEVLRGEHVRSAETCA